MDGQPAGQPGGPGPGVRWGWLCCYFCTVYAGLNSIIIVAVLLFGGRDLPNHEGPFVMYNAQARLCVSTDQDDRVALRACGSQPEGWMFHRGGLVSLCTFKCLTVVNYSTSVAAGDNLTSACKKMPHASTMIYQLFSDLPTMPTVRMRPCTYAPDQFWQVNGSALQHAALSCSSRNGSLMFPGLKYASAWCLSSGSAHATPVAQEVKAELIYDGVGTELSSIVEFRSCGSAQLCAGRGEADNWPACSCTHCASPWTGPFCEQVNQTEVMTCQDRKAVGPAKALNGAWLSTSLNLQTASDWWVTRFTLICASSCASYSVGWCAGQWRRDRSISAAALPLALYLICAQVLEVVALFWLRKSPDNFRRAEILFLCAQDIPQLLFAGVLICLKVFGHDSAAIDQYELYGLFSSTISVFEQSVRARNHYQCLSQFQIAPQEEDEDRRVLMRLEEAEDRRVLMGL